MKTFAIATLGCKVNQYESRQIIELLESLGLAQVRQSDNPELIVVNTCCVTQTASAKSRQQIHHAERLSPGATILICGCLPTVSTGELETAGQNVHVLTNRQELASTLSQLIGRQSSAPDTQKSPADRNGVIRAENGVKINRQQSLYPFGDLPPIHSFRGRTRAFLKVQDGCDGYCTYCIVPKTRPLVHSKSPDAVLREARSLVASGHKEIVITGVFLGAYGQTTVRRKNWPQGQSDRLPQLLEEVARIPGLARIRLSSLEPGDVTPRLLDVFCKYPNIMPHLHLSLQSGSDNVLKRMARQYNADDFRMKVALIKSCLDRPAITTDIIVGFPGENDSDFEQTVNMAKDAGFAKMHVFAFSPRKGTPAANMQDIVPNRVTRERSRILRELDKNLQRQFRRQFVGETAKVLLESDGDKPTGRSERYFMVCMRGGPKTLRKNDLVSAALLDNADEGMIGELT